MLMGTADYPRPSCKDSGCDYYYSCGWGHDWNYKTFPWECQPGISAVLFCNDWTGVVGWAVPGMTLLILGRMDPIEYCFLRGYQQVVIYVIMHKRQI